MVFSHWRLKLLAVLLASIAWLVSTGRDYTKVEKQVLLELEPPKNGVILLVGGRPRTERVYFDVELYGPRAEIEKLEAKALVGKHSFSDISVDDIQPGQVRTATVDLESIRMTLEDGSSLAPGVEVRVVEEPKVIEVKIDRVGVRWIDVECVLEYTTSDGSTAQITSFSTKEGCAQGYEITNYYANPEKAFVHGPSSVLKEIDRVKTTPAPIGGLRKNKDISVRIQPYVQHDEYGVVSLDCNDEIVIYVEVDEVTKSRKLEDCPVRLLKPAIYLPIVEIQAIDGKAVDPNAPTVDLEIRGTGVSDIVPQDHVRAYLDLTGSDNVGVAEKPLTVELPDGIRLVGEPPRVKYEVKPTE